MKTDKDTETLTFESVLGQLRHAYALLLAGDRAWTPEQRERFAHGLIGPQIKKLEGLAVDYAQRGEDLLAAFTANARYRRQLREIEEALMAKAHEIASASQARRIIMTAFHHEKVPDV